MTYDWLDITDVNRCTYGLTPSPSPFDCSAELTNFNTAMTPGWPSPWFDATDSHSTGIDLLVNVMEVSPYGIVGRLHAHGNSFIFTPASRTLGATINSTALSWPNTPDSDHVHLKFMFSGEDLFISNDPPYFFEHHDADTLQMRILGGGQHEKFAITRARDGFSFEPNQIVLTSNIDSNLISKPVGWWPAETWMELLWEHDPILQLDSIRVWQSAQTMPASPDLQISSTESFRSTLLRLNYTIYANGVYTDRDASILVDFACFGEGAGQFFSDGINPITGLCVTTGLPPQVPVPVRGHICELLGGGPASRYNASNAYTVGSTEVYVDGLFQRPGIDYSESNPATGELYFGDVITGPVYVCYDSAIPTRTI